MSGPTIVYNCDDYDVEKLSEELLGSMQGLGTSEDIIINILTKYSLEQRCAIAEQFKTAYGKDLIEELKSELGGYFEKICVAMLTPTTIFQAREINRAVSGGGTDEATLVEVFCTKSNDELKAISEAYQAEFENTLEEDIIGDTGGDFRNLLVSLVQGNRDEWGVDCSKVEEDAQKLFEAGEAMCGTEEHVINSILCLRSADHINEVKAKYQEISGKSLEEAIKEETSGSLENGFLSIIGFSEDKTTYYAKRLMKAIEGMGTDEADLIRVIVTRSEVDLADIKEKFNELYEKSLSECLEGECGGDFVKVLIKLVDGNCFS